MGQLDVNTIKNVLTSMLDTLSGQSRDTLTVLSRETSLCADATDRATLETDRHLALCMGERDRLLIGEIHAALARVEDGEYGVCQECGEEIGLARLRAQPTATLCVHCKSMIEALGQAAMLHARAESALWE
jgi:DnaK suppressor protein